MYLLPANASGGSTLQIKPKKPIYRPLIPQTAVRKVKIADKYYFRFFRHRAKHSDFARVSGVKSKILPLP